MLVNEGLGEENAWLRSTHEVVAMAVVAELGEEHANSKILGFMVFEISFALSVVERWMEICFWAQGSSPTSERVFLGGGKGKFYVLFIILSRFCLLFGMIDIEEKNLPLHSLLLFG